MTTEIFSINTSYLYRDFLDKNFYILIILNFNSSVKGKVSIRLYLKIVSVTCFIDLYKVCKFFSYSLINVQFGVC